MSRYIDADKLSSRVLDTWKKFEKQGKDCYVFADIFVPLIVSTPTEEVTPIVRGKWEFDEKGYYCNKCGYRPFAGAYQFCAVCGADMRTMEESEKTE